jgi:hypothetical protein
LFTKIAIVAFVVAQRQPTSFFQELLVRRFSATIIKTMENIAVWVAN